MEIYNRPNRNTYVDLLRGIGSLSVIAIHTTFWSGLAYAHLWMLNLVLVIDVGLFFFLAGWASTHAKRTPAEAFTRITKVWAKWIFFVIVLGIVTYPTKLGYETLIDMIKDFALAPTSVERFCVIGGSLWYINVYMLVVLTNSIILFFIDKFSVGGGECIKQPAIYTSFLLFMMFFYTVGNSTFGSQINFIDIYWLFYSVLYCFGFLYGKYTFNMKFSLYISLVIFFVGMMKLSSLVLGIPISPIQDNKFPPNMTYLFFNCIVIITFIYLRRFLFRCRIRAIEHIGKNAIWYYFAQGVGSSLLYYLVDKVTEVYWVKWLILYAINVLLTVCLAELFRYLYNLLQKLYNKAKPVFIDIMRKGIEVD